MKHLRVLILMSFSVLLFQSSMAEGIEFFHGTWAETLEKAHEEEKIIFVDSYTTWCGPCKRMSAKTFPDPKVGEYFNAHFVSVKIDMEKDAGLAFRRTYPVSAYPTLFFINSDGEVVLKSVGGKQPKDLIEIAKKANKNNDRSGKYAVEYEAGKRDFDLMYKYVKALNKAKKPSLKIANEYMASNPEITDKQRRQFLLEAAIEVDSKLFSRMLTEKKAIEKEFTQALVTEKIEAAVRRTAEKGIRFDAPSLIEESIEVMNTHVAGKAAYFESRIWMDYALVMRDKDLYKKHLKPFIKKQIGKNPQELNLVSSEILSYFKSEKDLMEIAEDASGKSFELKNIFKYLENHIKVLCTNGKTNKAIELIDQRIIKAENEENKKAIGPLKKLKQKISNT